MQSKSGVVIVPDATGAVVWWRLAGGVSVDALAAHAEADAAQGVV